MGNDESRTGGSGGPATSVIAKVKPKTKRPNLYRVLILNDDYTPMEFVVHVLEKFFQKDVEAATKIMLHVHHHGIGECGIFTYEIAETKVTQVMDFARKHQHPAMRDGKVTSHEIRQTGTGLHKVAAGRPARRFARWVTVIWPGRRCGPGVTNNRGRSFATIGCNYI
jgi:ATP-dependent Clp protease adaptor protein ClpS